MSSELSVQPVAVTVTCINTVLTLHTIQKKVIYSIIFLLSASYPTTSCKGVTSLLSLPDRVVHDVPLVDLPDRVVHDVPLVDLSDRLVHDVPLVDLPDREVHDVPLVDLPDRVVHAVHLVDLPDRIVHYVPLVDLADRVVHDVPLVDLPIRIVWHTSHGIFSIPLYFPNFINYKFSFTFY